MGNTQSKVAIHTEPAKDIPDSSDIFVVGDNEYGELGHQQTIKSLVSFNKFNKNIQIENINDGLFHPSSPKIINI